MGAVKNEFNRILERLEVLFPNINQDALTEVLMDSNFSVEECGKIQFCEMTDSGISSVSVLIFSTNKDMLDWIGWTHSTGLPFPRFFQTPIKSAIKKKRYL